MISILVVISMVLSNSTKAEEIPLLCDPSNKSAAGYPVAKLPDPENPAYLEFRKKLIDSWRKDILEKNNVQHELFKDPQQQNVRGNVDFSKAYSARKDFFTISYGQNGSVLFFCEAKRGFSRSLEKLQAESEKLKASGGNDSCLGAFQKTSEMLSNAEGFYEKIYQSSHIFLNGKRGRGAESLFDQGRSLNYEPIVILEGKRIQQAKHCDKGWGVADPVVKGKGWGVADPVVHCPDGDEVKKLKKEYEALWGPFKKPTPENRAPGGHYSNFLLQLQRESDSIKNDLLPKLYGYHTTLNESEKMCGPVAQKVGLKLETYNQCMARAVSCDKIACQDAEPDNCGTKEHFQVCHKIVETCALLKNE